MGELEEKLKRILHGSEKPIFGVDLADMLGIGGKKRTQKRRIRDIAKRMRDKRGVLVCATQQEGYWLAESLIEYVKWKKAMRNRDLYRFGQDRRNLEKAKDSHAGQGHLFDVGSNQGAFTR